MAESLGTCRPAADDDRRRSANEQVANSAEIEQIKSAEKLIAERKERAAAARARKKEAEEKQRLAESIRNANKEAIKKAARARLEAEKAREARQREVESIANLERQQVAAAALTADYQQAVSREAAHECVPAAALTAGLSEVSRRLTPAQVKEMPSEFAQTRVGGTNGDARVGGSSADARKGGGQPSCGEGGAYNSEAQSDHRQIDCEVPGQKQDPQTSTTNAPKGGELIALSSDVIEYRVLQRTLVKKLGMDPAAAGLAKVRMQVGSIVFTTGHLWMGPQGGQWVELDAVVEKPGWLLVQGPGFGLPGPLLQKVELGEPATLILHAAKPQQDPDETNLETREFVLSIGAKVADLREWIALLFGLDLRNVIIAAPGADKNAVRDGVTEQCKILQDSVRVVEAGFKDGDRVPFVYTGNLEKAYEGKEPTWSSRLGDPKEQPKRVVPQSPFLPEVREHFETLKIPQSTPPTGIKRQYRKLALESHPDKHPDDPSATHKFQQLTAAFEAIRDMLNL